jgi:hypothetical protein
VLNRKPGKSRSSSGSGVVWAEMLHRLNYVATRARLPGQHVSRDAPWVAAGGNVALQRLTQLSSSVSFWCWCTSIPIHALSSLSAHVRHLTECMPGARIACDTEWNLNKFRKMDVNCCSQGRGQSGAILTRGVVNVPPFFTLTQPPWALVIENHTPFCNLEHNAT